MGRHWDCFSLFSTGKGLAFFLLLMTPGLSHSKSKCDELAREPEIITPSDVYNLLGRETPSQNQAIRLFEEARTNPALREELNEGIESTSKLSSMADEGLQFKNELRTFLDREMNPGHSGLSAILHPTSELQRNFESFKRELLSHRDVPLTDLEADRLATNDTVNRFGGNPHSPELSANYEVRYYYNRQKQRYLQTDTRRPAWSPKEKRDRFLHWIKKTLENYQEQRIQNLRLALLSLLRYDEKSLEVQLLRAEHAKDGRFLKYSTIGSSLSLDERQIQNLEMSVVQGNSESLPLLKILNEPGVGLHRWDHAKIQLLYYYTTRGKELFGEVDPSLANAVVLLSPTDPEFLKTSQAILEKRKLPSSSSGTYGIQITEVLSLFERYIQRLGKTSLQESSKLASELLLRVYRDEDLARLIAGLEAYQTHPDWLTFEKAIPSFIPEENNFLRNARDLEKIGPEDPVSGVEWYGNKIHSEHWKNRDESLPKKSTSPNPTFKTTESLPARFWNGTKDRFLKLREITRQAMVLGAVVGATYFAVIKGEKYVEPVREKVQSVLGIERPTSNSDSSGQVSIPAQPQPVIRLSGDFKPAEPETASEKSHPRKNETQVELFSVEAKQDTFYTLNSDYSNFPKSLDSIQFSEDYVFKKAGKPKELPVYFNQASNLELSEINRMKDITQTVTHYEDQYRMKRNHGFAQIISFVTRVDVRATQGQLVLPRPEDGYELTYFYIYPFDSKVTTPIAAIRVHPQTGQYLVEIKPEFRNLGFQYRAEFARVSRSRKDASRKIEPHPIEDIRLKSLDQNHLQKASQDMRAAGLTHLAHEMERKLSTSSSISVEDLADLISKTQIYSLSPGIAPLDSSAAGNPYFQFSQYLRNGRLFMKCDVANHLLQTLLKDALKDSKDIHIDHFYSFIYSPEHHGIGSIGHARTLIRVDGLETRKIIDATPSRSLDGTVADSPWEHYSQEAGKREESLLRLHPPPPPSAPGKNRADGQGNKKSPDDREPEFPPGTEPPERVKVETRPLRPDEVERMKKYHEEWLRDLEGRAEALLHDPLFVPLVKNRDVLPPVRIYRLSRGALRLVQKEITLEAFLDQARTLYPGEIPARISSSEELKLMFKSLFESESALWEKLNRHFELNRNSPFWFAANARFKSQVLNLLDQLQSYTWEAIPEN